MDLMLSVMGASPVEKPLKTFLSTSLELEGV